MDMLSFNSSEQTAVKYCRKKLPSTYKTNTNSGKETFIFLVGVFLSLPTIFLCITVVVLGVS